MTRSTVRFAAAVLLGIGAALTGAAQPVSSLKQWEASLNQTSQMLANGEFAPARERLLTLANEIADSISASGNAGRLLASALVQLAVAEVAGGDSEDGIWYWQIAQNIDPLVKDRELSGYGAPGDVLRKHVLPPTPERCTRSAAAPSPTVTKRVEPTYPKAARQRSIAGLVIVELRLDSTGRPIQPQVLKTPLPSLTYSTLLALREWRFEVPPDPSEEAPFCRLFSFGSR